MTDWRGLLRERETPTRFVVEGRLAVERLLASDYVVEKVIRVGEDLTKDEASELVGYQFHRGHLAMARKPEPVGLTAFGEGTLVVLPEIADPGNLGTIIRNTVALGGCGILLGKGASPWNAKAVRASAGTLFRIPVRQSDDLLSDLTALKADREFVGASLSEGAIPLKEVKLTKPPALSALLLGPEDFGLTAEVELLCDHLAYLPMANEVDSLNVASASAIFLHELRELFA